MARTWSKLDFDEADLLVVVIDACAPPSRRILQAGFHGNRDALCAKLDSPLHQLISVAPAGLLRTEVQWIGPIRARQGAVQLAAHDPFHRTPLAHILYEVANLSARLGSRARRIITSSLRGRRWLRGSRRIGTRLVRVRNAEPRGQHA